MIEYTYVKCTCLKCGKTIVWCDNCGADIRGKEIICDKRWGHFCGIGCLEEFVYERCNHEKETM